MTTKKIGFIATIAIVLGLAGATWASASDPPAPTSKVPTHVSMPPVVAEREVTRPGEVTVQAWFWNGEVYRLVTPTKTFVVEHGNGNNGTKIVGGRPWVETVDGRRIPDPAANPNAFDPKARQHPTPEQRALMTRIADEQVPAP